MNLASSVDLSSIREPIVRPSSHPPQINDAGDIVGFYTDAAGVFHGFIATPTTTTAAVPEPGSVALMGFGLSVVGFGCLRRRKRAFGGTAEL